MKKMYLFVLAMVLGIFILPTLILAQTFNLPAPVYVSGDASGKLFFKSDNPVALDKIDGVVQFHNDIMKERGWGMTKNAFCEGTRVNPNLLTVSLYDDTIKTQFSFNIKLGALWGLIPSCNLVPDNKTVITEYSGPSRDSEDENGGHHFSLIAGISDPSYYKRAANIRPCPTGVTAGVKEEKIVEQIIPPEHVRVVSIAKKSVPVKKALKKKCDPCEAITEVKADTSTLRKNIGEANQQEKENGLISLHDKTTMIAQGIGSLNDKIGEPKKGENVFGLLKKIDKQTSPPPPTPPVFKKTVLGEDEESSSWNWFYFALVAIALVFLGALLRGSRRG